MRLVIDAVGEHDGYRGFIPNGVCAVRNLNGGETRPMDGFCVSAVSKGRL
jgi:hypothetical protein